MNHIKYCNWHLVVVVCVAMAMFASCGSRGTGGAAEDARRLATDSLLSSVKDVDSLAAIVDEAHKQDDAVREIMALRYQGRRLRQLARFGEAIAVLNHGLDLATEHEDTIEMVLALSSIGDVNRRQGEMSASNGCYYKALHLIEEASNRTSERAIRAEAAVLNGIGNVEIDLCNFVAADSVLHRALGMEEKLDRSLGRAVNCMDLGQVKIAQGDLDSAWYYYRKSMEFSQIAGSSKSIALCHMHYGELYEAEKRFSHAIKEYNIAYDKLKEIGDVWQWVKPCLSLAHVHILLGEEDEAEAYLREAEENARRIGSKQLIGQADMIHYELSLLRGDSQGALQYYVDGTALYDSIFGMKKSDEMRAQRIAYQNGRKSGEMSVLNSDITRLKRMRNAMGLLGVLLTLMAGAIIAALIYAMRVRSRSQRVMRQIEETRSLFFTNVVHRLRTPLTAIMGAIDNLSERAKKASSPLSSEALENVEIIEGQGNNLLELVDRILEVGGVRSAISNPDWVKTDAVPFIRMVIESYREQCLGRHIEFTFVSREKSIEVETLPNYLSTIVGNIIENAIYYSKDFSKITVTLREEGGNLIIRVADNGMGISQTDLPHVFEAFFRGAMAEQIIDGVGIGLTVVRDMTMALGGSVAVDSQKDQGSVFTVTLPCKQEGGVKKRAEVIVPPKIKHKIKELTQKREKKQAPVRNDKNLPVVLVVEDHTDVAHLVGNVLDDRFAVYFASDGEQGLARAMELEPDLIITDVKMPIMNGLELCRRIRASRQLCHIPVIMLSARTSKDERVQGIQAGADAYLVKPFAQDELIEWVVRLLKNREILSKFYSDTLSESSCGDGAVSQAGSGSEVDDDFLRRFGELVNEQIASGAMKLDYDKLALSFKMGESALRRKVMAMTGKNVAAYVMQLRMEKAMTLLQNHPEMLIGDIAESCGFADMAYFSRVFRQHYGMTPTQARSGNGNGSK